MSQCNHTPDNDGYCHYCGEDINPEYREFACIPIQVGGWGTIEECRFCHKTDVSGVIPFPDKNWNFEEQVCNECLKKYCKEI